jgi:hypothetical protein
MIMPRICNGVLYLPTPGTHPKKNPNIVIDKPAMQAILTTHIKKLSGIKCNIHIIMPIRV